MSRFIYENQGTNTYLVYTISPEDVVDSMSLGMLTNNKIPGIATTLFTQMDATKYLKYNVSAKVSVRQFFAGAVNKKRLIGVFRGIVDALLSAEEYMIDENTILIDLDYMFVDVSTCDTVLICLPIQNAVEQHDLGAFFKGIMFETQFDQTENCDHVARIINYLNSTPLFSVSDFKDLLEKIRLESSSSSLMGNETAPTVQPTIETEGEAHSFADSQKEVTDSVSKPAFEVTSTANEDAYNQQKVTIEEGKAVQDSDTENEKKLTMLNLLMHYSKENAELYKSQKSSRSNRKSSYDKGKVKTNFAIPGVLSSGSEVSDSKALKTEQTDNLVQTSGKNNVLQTKSQVQPSSSPANYHEDSPHPVTQGRTANFGETVVLEGGAFGETVVLTSSSNKSAQTAVPFLIRKKNNEKIPLTKPIFHIGKEKSFADYFISDNSVISRSHAYFITRYDKIYVVDTNSTNHTYVNDRMIRSNEEIELTHGDTVRLANEDFEFRLY